jgi:hypothetical protein
VIVGGQGYNEARIRQICANFALESVYGDTVQNWRALRVLGLGLEDRLILGWDVGGMHSARDLRDDAFETRLQVRLVSDDVVGYREC